MVCQRSFILSKSVNELVPETSIAADEATGEPVTEELIAVNTQAPGHQQT